MNNWNGKHPVPYDFFFAFSRTAGQNLDWFFRPWFFESKYPDLSLTAKKIEGGTSVNVFNKGGLPVPIKIKFYYDDGTDAVVYDKTASEWKNGNTGITSFFASKKKVIKAELGTPQIPDVNLKDNTVEFK